MGKTSLWFRDIQKKKPVVDLCRSDVDLFSDGGTTDVQKKKSKCKGGTSKVKRSIAAAVAHTSKKNDAGESSVDSENAEVIVKVPPKKALRKYTRSKVGNKLLPVRIQGMYSKYLESCTC